MSSEPGAPSPTVTEGGTFPPREWTQNPVAYPTDLLLSSLTERQVATDRVAVRSRAGELSYPELHARTDRLAHRLRELGVGPDDLVGVCMERSIDLVVALHATVKAGGAYVPLDPDYPRHRLEFVLQDARPHVVLTDRASRHLLPDVQAGVLCVDGDDAGRRSDVPKPIEASPDHLAYVIYTSGSTGQPKGAMNTHRGICNRLLWMQDAFPIGSDDVVIQKTPFSFDVSVWEFFWPLMTGARLVVADPGRHGDPQYLAELIHREQVTVMHFVPSMLRLFLDAPGLESRCASLRHVICSGESLTRDLQDRFFARLNADLHNLYGPTEAAVDVTHWTCVPGDQSSPVPIGRPVANTEIHLRGEDGHPVPVGQPGELWIGGVQVARGYLNRPDLTAERFVPSPSDPEGQERLYRTGDLARWRDDGVLEFLGRNDYQVKIRGVRVELEEVQAVIERHPGVSRAVVTVDQDVPGVQRLVGYLAPQQSTAFTVHRILNLESSDARRFGTLYDLPNGLVVSSLNRGETDFLYDEIFEQGTYFKHGIAIGDGAHVFDVGANIGMFSLFAAGAAADTVIYAFEPVPPIFDALETTASLYDYDIRPQPFGLADTNRTATLTYYPHVSILSGFHADPDADRSVVRSYVLGRDGADAGASGLPADALEALLEDRLRQEDLPCELRTISQVIEAEGVERIDLLKIDVERSEHEVLAGIQPADWARILQVVAEVHDLDGRLADILTLLQRHGFRVTTRRNEDLGNSGHYTVYAVRAEEAGSRPSGKTDAPGRPPARWHRPAQLVSSVQALLTERLPEVMIPSTFVVVDEVPLTLSGKVDRNALPAPNRERPELDHTFVPASDELQALLSTMWADILHLERVGIRDRFFELGGDSIGAARFVAQLQQQLDEFIYVITIFEHPTIAEYSAFLRSEYPEALHRRFGASFPVASGGETHVDTKSLERFDRAVPQYLTPDGDADGGAPNQPAIFILSPPRSGTTLLRVMMAGHPRLYGGTELQLLTFNDLAERQRAFTGKFSAWLEGLLRVVMDVKACDANEAKAIVAEFERRATTTKEFYGILQSWIGGRVLVDKSPSYALDPLALEKAERDFRNPFYVHLVRHPVPMIRSFERIHMDQVLFLKQHDFSTRQLGELVWTASHRNIRSFLDSVPRNRYLRLSYEDLVTQPLGAMQQLCEALGIDYDAEMIRPYGNQERKLVDGIHEESTPMGDVKFREYGSIETAPADRWRMDPVQPQLGDVTWEVARAVGYDPDPGRSGDGSAKPDAHRAADTARRTARRRRRRGTRDERGPND